MTRLSSSVAGILLCLECVASTVTNPVIICDDGGWCWYQDERAIFVGDQLLVGSMSSAGEVNASILAIPSMTATTVVLKSNFQVDDHNLPSFLHRDDGYTMAFYSTHGSDNLMRYRVTSTNTGDLTKWDPEQTLDHGAGVTYSNPFQLAEEDGKIYLFFRGASIDPHYWSTTNRAVTWDGAFKLMESPGERPYVKCASDGSNTIHFIYTEAHPDRAVTTSIYHMYYRNGGLYQSDGTFLTNLVDAPIPPQAGTKIYDGTNATGEAWTWDVHLDSNGYPVVPYATFAGRSPDDHRYRYARWDGSQWHDRQIAYAGTRLYAGQQSYSGGICVDPEQPNVVYISSDVDITNGAATASGRYEIYRGETADLGQSWTWRAITPDSPMDNLRPIVPIGHTNETTVLWEYGTYASYTTYDLEIVGLFGSNLVVAPPEPAPIWHGYSIDLNDGDAPVTKNGWTGLNADHGTGVGAALANGVRFETFSAGGARLRGSVTAPNPDSLMGDFAFDDGAGYAVGLMFGGTNGVPAGDWVVDIYIHDAGYADGGGNMIVGYRRNTQETIVGSNVAAGTTGPAITFDLAIDGVGAYDVFVRENNTSNRSRLNAVRLRKRIDVPCAYSEAVLDQGPLEFYRLDSLEGEFGDAFNVHGVDFHRPTPDPALSSEGDPAYDGFGARNTWANFDGAATSALTDLATNWNSDAGSVSFWVRMDEDGLDGTQTGLFGRQAGGGGQFGGGMMTSAIGTFMRKDGSFGITIDNNQHQTAAGRLTLNEWHHLAYTWDRNTGATNGVVRMYVDGVEEAGYTNVSWSSFTIDEVRFGKEITGGDRVLDGSADELAIWSRALSREEILTQYWRSMKPRAEVVFSEGFEGYDSTSGGAGAPLPGQGGWSGSNTGVRRDLQGWSGMGGEWAYGRTAANIMRKTIGTFAGQEGTMTIEFCGRANSQKSLFSLGVDDGGYQEFVYFGADETYVRLMPTDGSGTRHDTRTPFATAESQLMRMRLVVDLDIGTGSMSYYDGSDWQAPAPLQGLDMYLRSGRAANDPANWNAVELNGQRLGAWDNIAIVYEPPPPPEITGILLIVR